MTPPPVPDCMTSLPQPADGGKAPETAAAFIYAMADRYVERTSPPMSRETAIVMAVAMLAERECDDGPFGDERFAWDVEGAREIVDEDMSYWEKA